ncbi:hypothetical protein RHMOL_Rhmol04G0335700 [Rhododendron molle]|uniref:Uncharacterized protein n=1 Tax=Rhododendron molle TaxID=49168 RepID=A0ACC0P6T2_RHOML|nr:hypothetical protein RHMOL_Rhmol04G0335700 [Rhododendron molle]
MPISVAAVAVEVALATTFPVRRTVEMSFGSQELGCNAEDDDRVLLEVAKVNKGRNEFENPRPGPTRLVLGLQIEITA